MGLKKRNSFRADFGAGCFPYLVFQRFFSSFLWYNFLMGGPKARGFTLIEVVVVIGVMAIISSLMLANFPRFNKQISVEREAGKLALSLRKAQSYALAVREFNPAFNDDPFCASPPVKFPGYGLFFKVSDPTRYFIYGDVNCSKYYENILLEEAAEIINIESNVKIFSIKGYDAAVCGGGCDLDELSILYVRPGPTILIKSNGIDYNFTEIYLRSSDGAVSKKVVIRSTGQVSIE